MGSDKGLLTSSGKTWTELAFNKLAALRIEVHVSVQADQQAAYARIFSDKLLIADALPLRGPLAGLLSAHQNFPETDWLILACDLPDMTDLVLHELRQTYRQNLDYECFVFADESEIEPLCGIYTAAGLRKIMDLFKRNLLAKHSMKHVLEISKSRVLELPSEWKPAFKNYNFPFEQP